MDIVLEVADTFLFDHIYSTILPSHAPQEANASLSSITHESMGFIMPKITWQYEPASKYCSIQPSQAAYESAWSRDDWRRQFVTLYLITWYGQECSSNMHTYH
jgi:lathosterol oxidase